MRIIKLMVSIYLLLIKEFFMVYYDINIIILILKI